MNDRPFLAAWRDALRDSSLDTTAKAVGFVIATYCDRNGTNAFPSKATLAAGASLKSTRAADGAVIRLEHAGLIEVSRSVGRSSNRYKTTLPTLHGDAGIPRTHVQGSENGNPAPNDAQPRTEVPPTPHGDAGESVESERTKTYTRAARARTTVFEEYDR